MEIKIPKEVRNYTESIFMGLNLKQCVMSGIAIGLAVPVFISLRPALGLEGASWVCVFIVAPVGATAFIKIKTLPLFDFIIAVVKWFLTRNPLLSQPKNIYLASVRQLRYEKKKPAKKLIVVEEVFDEPDEADC